MKQVNIFQVDSNGNDIEERAINIEIHTDEVRCVRTADHYSPAEYEGGGINEITCNGHDITKEVLMIFDERELLDCGSELNTTESIEHLLHYMD